MSSREELISFPSTSSHRDCVLQYERRSKRVQWRGRALEVAQPRDVRLRQRIATGRSCDPNDPTPKSSPGAVTHNAGCTPSLPPHHPFNQSQLTDAYMDQKLVLMLSLPCPPDSRGLIVYLITATIKSKSPGMLLFMHPSVKAAYCIHYISVLCMNEVQINLQYCTAAR